MKGKETESKGEIDHAAMVVGKFDTSLFNSWQYKNKKNSQK
jgi:hypothetical protein